ncbi:MAG: RHS repeat-associated core domain-containing protein, partial [Bacteroidota bacterium]
ASFTLEEVDAENGYRFGFNGKEKDNETYGEGNEYDFGARIYDSRLGKWLSVDPLQMDYPWLSPYNFCANNPIFYIDPDGKKVVPTNPGAKEAFEAIFTSAGMSSNQMKAICNLMPKPPVQGATEVFMSLDQINEKPLSEKEFIKRADENGVKLDKKSESTKNAYTAYLAIVSKEEIQVEVTSAASGASTTTSRGNSTGAYVVSSNPGYADPIVTPLRTEYINKMQADGGVATIENVQSTFNGGKTSQLADKSGTNWVYAQNPDVKSNVKGFIMVNTTNTTPAQRGINLAQALKEVLKK